MLTKAPIRICFPCLRKNREGLVMEHKINAGVITRTALLLAICIVFQLLKGISVYITGPAVNCVIVLAVFSCGLTSGTIISVIAPLVAYIVGATPVINMIPLMLPVIMAGNFLTAFGAWLCIKYKQIFLLFTGAGLKALFLWLTVWYVMLPVFGQGIPEPAQKAIRFTFSVTQLITALIGCAIALVIWKIAGKYINRGTY